MEQVTVNLSYINASLFSILIMAAALWKADDVFLSESGAKVIYKSIKDTAAEPGNSEISKSINEFIDGYFSPGNGYGRFFLNVFILTLASLLTMLSVYTVKTDGLFEQLLSGGFLYQFFGNGFVVTYLVNYFVFLSYPFLIMKISMSDTRTSIFVLILDMMVKVLLFILFTSMTYMLLAEFYGSFTGSKLVALTAVPDTLLLATQFNNLTSVYLYSIILSSFPIFIVVLINLMRTSALLSMLIRRTLFWLPFEAKPLRAISVVFSIFVGLFLLILSLFLTLIS